MVGHHWALFYLWGHADAARSHMNSSSSWLLMSWAFFLLEQSSDAHKYNCNWLCLDQWGGGLFVLWGPLKCDISGLSVVVRTRYTIPRHTNFTVTRTTLSHIIILSGRFDTFNCMYDYDVDDDDDVSCIFIRIIVQSLTKKKYKDNCSQCKVA